MIMINNRRRKKDYGLRPLELWKKILRSNFIWHYSGISVPTSIYVTKGSFMNIKSYIGLCSSECEFLKSNLSKEKTVLEFGSGLGGNLISVSTLIKSGVGVDINKLYIKKARRLTRNRNISNLKFVSYDGVRMPTIGKFDVIFSLNVFERIPKPFVISYVKQMSMMLDNNGTMFFSFLNKNAINTGFAKRLGTNAYVWWEREELYNLANELHLRVSRFMEFKEKEYIIGLEG